MSNNEACKDERSLNDEIPLTCNEDGECIYCGNMAALENANLSLRQQIEKTWKLIEEKDKLLFELSNENTEYKRVHEAYEIAIRRWEASNAD